jgi:hypothetical protein
MKLKTGSLVIALLLTLAAFAGVVHAIPNGATSWVGPRPLDPCAVPQALGYAGDQHGSAMGTGANGYHSYSQGAGVGALDACFDPSGVPGFTGCALAAQLDADSHGTATIKGDPTSAPVLIQGLSEILDPTLGGGHDYQTECGGLIGSATDGEFEWGTNEAVLNVRVGPAAAGPEAGYGDGVTRCLGSLATAHHGSDTTIYVADAALGGGVGFSVYADWARAVGQSDTGIDQNRDPGLSAHCGDGVLEPCTTTAQAGVQNDVTTYGGGSAAVADVTANTEAPTSSIALKHDLDVVGGCNPLDTVVNVAPSLANLSPFGGPNSFTDGTTLTSATYGYGGANGMLTVIVNHGPQGVCYDAAIPGACPAGLGGVSGHASIQGAGAAPTFGWIWTGP